METRNSGKSLPRGTRVRIAFRRRKSTTFGLTLRQRRHLRRLGHSGMPPIKTQRQYRAFLIAFAGAGNGDVARSAIKQEHDENGITNREQSAQAPGEEWNDGWEKDEQASGEDGNVERAQGAQATGEDEDITWNYDGPPSDRSEAQLPRGRPFRKGESGNPAGRPKGSRNRTTLMAEAMLEEGAEGLMTAAIARGQDGDAKILGILIPLLMGKDRERPIQIPLKLPNNPAEIPNAMKQITQLVFAGEITMYEAEKAIKILKLAIDTSYQYRHD
jgi:hypothetical protein